MEYVEDSSARQGWRLGATNCLSGLDIHSESFVRACEGTEESTHSVRISYSLDLETGLYPPAHPAILHSPPSALTLTTLNSTRPPPMPTALNLLSGAHGNSVDADHSERSLASASTDSVYLGSPMLPLYAYFSFFTKSRSKHQAPSVPKYTYGHSYRCLPTTGKPVVQR